MNCYLRGTLNDLRVTTFFPKDFKLQSAIYELPAHSYRDLILTSEPYKGIMYSAALLNSYWIRLSIACSQTLYFLFKVRQARVIKKTAGDLLTASARTHFFSLSRARGCFRKERKQKKSLVNFSETSIRTMATPVNCACIFTYLIVGEYYG